MVSGREINFKKQQILDAIKGSYGITSNVAKRLNVTWETARKYINKWEETKQALINENEAFGDFVELKAMKRIDEDSEQMIRFYLATKFKNRGFSEKHEMELTGKDGDPIKFIEIGSSE